MVLDEISGLQDNPISSVVMSGLVLVHFVIQVSAKPLRTLRSKFASSYFCKNVSRKGAKREKNSLNIIFAPLRLCGKCLVVAVLLSESGGFRLNLHNRRDAEDAEVAQRLET